jgi:hypothetical protein
VAVQVVEIFEQPEMHCLTEVRGLARAARDMPSGNRHLLVAECYFQDRLIAGIQPVDGRLLLVLNAPNPRLQRFDVAQSCKGL